MNELGYIQNQIDSFKEKNHNESVGKLSDGFHTFDELYHHRTTLLSLALRCLPYAWKSKKHEDGTMYDDMFIVGAPTPYGMITYHCDNCYWGLFKIPVIPHAPKFDGHTPDDVLERIENTIMNSSSNLLSISDSAKIEKILTEEILPTFDTPIDKAAFISFYHKIL